MFWITLNILAKMFLQIPVFCVRLCECIYGSHAKREINSKHL